MVLWLAPVCGRRWALAAALALVFATPLFFYGVTLWEHSLTVAASLTAWLWLDRDSPARLFGAGCLLASACWLREEIALMVNRSSVKANRFYALTEDMLKN